MPGRIRMSDAGEWLVTGVSPDVAGAFLRKHAPWRMEVNFDGMLSSQFGQYQPYNRTPFSKLREILKFVPEANLREGQILDIGFNAGYNSLYMAQQYGARVTGIDIVEKHKRTAEDLASILGLGGEFILESAESFERTRTFDLIMHFGTLYHLANPVMSIDKCVRSLEPGGWFALETMCYRAGNDPAACKWIYGFDGDKTNFWSLGKEALRSMVLRSGITHLKLSWRLGRLRISVSIHEQFGSARRSSDPAHTALLPELKMLARSLRVAPANASTSLSNTPPKKSLDGAAARSTLQHSPRKHLF